MKGAAGKTWQALERRDHRLAQWSGGVDQELRPEGAFATGEDLPLPGAVVPFDPLDIGLQLDFVAQLVAIDHMLGIAVQFGLFGEHLRPGPGGE